jgi:phosphoribosylaminoimidazolecarboxamide formyltransferase/IMP cyclohydrolase
MQKRALISVYDKSNVLELARGLAGMGWELVSTGGTAAYLRQNGLDVVDVSVLTGFPECLDGRVKTLHPAVHAGILARRGEKEHIETLERLKLGTIDLVAVNLYPFFEKVVLNLSLDQTVEFIDIGGPTMLRSAAKNFHDVIALTDPADYGEVIQGLKAGNVSDGVRKRLAGKVFNLTSAYDAAISRYLLEEDFPSFYQLPLRKGAPLRYGENAHQRAAIYLHAGKTGVFAGAEQLGGKEMGYNNIRDLDLAWKAACSFGLAADGTKALGAEDLKLIPGSHTDDGALACCVAVKHNTPCGISQGKSLSEAFDKAYACDPVSIFGGIVACNVKVDAESAKKMGELFLEIVAAPDFDEDALAIHREKKNLRKIRVGTAPKDWFEYAGIDNGLLVQEVNRSILSKWDLVTKTPVDKIDIPDLIFGLRTVLWVKSNAIVVVKDRASVGIGGGETNRISAAHLALERAAKVCGKGQARVLASDAFFPFSDVVEAAAEAGIKTVIQSGGSNNDGLSIEACDRHGIAMVFTGARCFKH